ncbi:transcriptional regulator, LysR family [Alloactinosynnema sp. L-07]|uniref:LysR family transcriptional regulator n=1 Tax=Alloactinosynnema sp. L-07 TaxID=1653480 RepID=UPI00065EFF67|nr:LysR family transcriptional regulator [Alloactinosynnema sp. L-07]CRK59548.1 transcriptional regulator, LysR family [Alloactinosynnema sp. L-07]
MELEFRHLRIVIVVADEGSITKAAAALGLSQPSLTSQLQRIERAMGAPLFDRARTGVIPTSFGRTVLVKARAVLQEMADLRGDATAAPPGPNRQIELRIGGIPGALVPTLVPRLIGLHARAAGPDSPPLKVAVHTDPSVASLLAKVRAGRVDAAILVEGVGFEGSGADGVRRDVIVPVEPQFVALAEWHPLAAHETVDLAALAEENWIVDPQEDHGGVAALRWACRNAGFDPRITHEASDSVSAREFVTSGQCVSLAQPTSKEGMGLVVRPLVGDPLVGRVELAWKDPSPVDPELMREAVAVTYSELVNRNPSYTKWWAENGVLLA